MTRRANYSLSWALLPVSSIWILAGLPSDAQASPCADLTPNCVEIVANRDTSIFDGASLLNHGNGALFAGRAGGMGSLRRGLLAFDASEITGRTVLSVSLQLCLSGTGDNDNRTYTLNLMARDWGESGFLGGGTDPTTDNQATWGCAMNAAGSPGPPPVGSTTCNASWGALGGSQAGSDVFLPSSASLSIGTERGTCSSFATTTTLVSDVQGMVDNPGANFGWQLRGDESGVSQSVRLFHSREGPEHFVPTLRILLAPPQPLGVRIEQVMAGANGDARIQYVELKIDGADAATWGPQGSETDSRMLLSFRDSTGRETGSFEFATDPPVGPVNGESNGSSVLVGTSEFETASGISVDFLLPAASLQAVGGQVCFQANLDNPNAPPTNVCLSYGDYALANTEEEDGCSPTSTAIGNPAPSLTIAGPSPSALVRTTETTFGCSTVGNAAFETGTPVPRNSNGDVGSIAAASELVQGRTLFTVETFAGNGRTCASCHVEADDFGLAPSTVTALFATNPDDPLFIHLNDDNLMALEDDCLLRSETVPAGGRALSLENIDGFDNLASFRNSAHLLNIAATAPYGLSADLDNTMDTTGMGFANLRDFCRAAIEQHLPKTLDRNSDPSAGLAGPALDFREPTSFELQAMETFQNSIVFPPSGTPTAAGDDMEPDLSGLIADFLAANPGDTDAVTRGQDLFFGRTGNAQCFICHTGPALANSDGTLGPAGKNLAFDIGAQNVAGERQETCAEPLPGADQDRKFSTTQLLGVARTAPFFHDHGKLRLREAIQHYRDPPFSASPAGVALTAAGRPLSMSGAEANDITKFLEAISVPEPSSHVLGIAALCTIAALRSRLRKIASLN
jgi:hypothetical protein